MHPPRTIKGWLLVASALVGCAQERGSHAWGGAAMSEPTEAPMLQTTLWCPVCGQATPLTIAADR